MWSILREEWERSRMFAAPVRLGGEIPAQFRV
jgi:hypothetical protein